ncbi:ATP-binding cassette domain-containing protein [Lichenicola cladoniae]|uniref:ATP-binding cassette domain-containing protein n=1 Tax=Lichenicola cladoniae TaxID=1484109 RepID=A0A6M8HST7_9PROT|nr:ATP-binding cassette domain-containing protein [Lichenicola cladoniae]NPD65712.1 ATP-binding cassette domain-containing protein [Acetobacteraceae bacterium]QKE91267.1 ATP-binding cassette domain-containing protein [Lichenicola cladoniae]
MLDGLQQAAGAGHVRDGAGAASLANVRKVFGGVVALAHADFELRPGEVLALLGENGAGKSTCVKMLAGVHRPDEGSVRLDGKDVVLRSPHDALANGIAVMHQHPGLFPDLTVAENIAIGHMPLTRLKQLDQRRIEADAARLLQVVGLDCAPRRSLGLLRSSEQQLVEVARALSVDARVLIMDEPTAALSRGEVERLFAVVEQLKKRGVAMMFVGHRMEEIYRIADRVVVLRDGRQVGMAPIGDLSPADAVTMMVGRELGTLYPTLDPPRDTIVLQADGLSRRGAFTDVSFDLHAGQILGFGGLVGSGRTEVARVLFGIDQPTAGTIAIDGVRHAFRSAGAAMQAGVGYVSEDRLGQSLVMDFSILDNASLTVLRQAARHGLISRDRELALVEQPLDRMNLRFSSYDQPVSTLSGGNQQKVVLAKWLATAPRVLILDEPTQGIDVNAKAEVHAIIADLARGGMAIILISSEMPELLGMCHDILVFREGHVSARMQGKDATQQSVLLAATDAAGAARKTSAADAVAGATDAVQAARHDPAVRPPAPRRSLFRREFGLVAAIVAMIVPATLINPRMLSLANIDAVAMDLALLIIVAAGQMLVMITRNIDLSVASVIGLSAYLCADALHRFPGLPLAGAVAIAGLVGLGCGIVNGLVVTRGRVPSIVVTLGTLSLYRGLCSMIAGGRQISTEQVPQAWLDMTAIHVLGIPVILIAAAVALALLAAILQRLPQGRELFAVGSNPAGARLIGISSDRLVLGAFACAGLLAGLDGALWASRYATVDARVASGYELTVIAAVVVGGTAIRGGAGTITGIVLGALMLLVIQNGLTLVRVNPLWLQGVYGLVIVLAISLDAFVSRRALRSVTERTAR